MCITVLGCVYATLIILLNIPYIQQNLSNIVSKELSHLLNTEVSISQINIGLLNRIILDDVNIQDLENEPLLKASRMSAKFSISELFRGKITIHNIQLYQMQLNLSRRDSLSNPNYQFLIDALSSDKPSTNNSNLNLRINAILIRDGKIAYHITKEKETPGIFNPNHLSINSVRANISLKALMNDSVNTTVRHLSFTDQSGFTLRNLAFKLTANTQGLTLSRFMLELPSSQLMLDTLKVFYNTDYEKKELKNIRFKGGINESFLTPADLKSFIPSLASFYEPLWLKANIQGNSNEITLSQLLLHTDNNDIRLNLYCRLRNPFNPDMTFIDCNLHEFNISNTGFRFITQNLDLKMSPLLVRLGYFSFNGQARGSLKNLLIQGLLQSTPGTIETNLHLNIKDSEKTIDGNISTNNFQLGYLLDESDLGNVSLNINIKGSKPLSGHPMLNIKGEIPLIEYKQHPYTGILINTSYNQGKHNIFLDINDPYGALTMKGTYNPILKLPELDMDIRLDHFQPQELHLCQTYPNTEFSVRAHTSIKGNTPDNLMGHICIDSLTMVSNKEHYFLKHFTVSSGNKNKEREILVNSDFINGKVKGIFTFKSLPDGIIRFTQQYLPSLVGPDTKKPIAGNRIEFDFSVSNTDLLEKVFHIPFTLHMPGTIKGYFCERNNQIKLESYLPSFSYKDAQYESGMILIDNPQNKLQTVARLTKQMESHAMLNLSLKAVAEKDQLKTAFEWGNNTEVTYSGTFATLTEFSKHTLPNSPICAKINIHPSDVIINDTVWSLRNSTIDIDSGRVAINNFCFEHENQHLRINGNLTESENDSLCIDLNDIRLEYIFDILQFHPVDFRGFASGKAYIKQTMKNPALDALLHIKQFTFNHGLMGDMNIRGLWNAEEGNIHLDADIQDKQRKARTTVKGWVSPKINGLNLNIKAENTNLEFLNTYTQDIFEHITGNVTGNINLWGPFSDLNLEGEATGMADTKVSILKTDYHLKLDSVSLLRNSIVFRKASMKDKEGNIGKIQGTLYHNHLRDMRYKFTFDTDNVLLYNAPDSNGASIYGKIYGTGNTTLQGGGNELNVNTNIRTGKNTTFVYNLGTPEELTDNNFITFVDKTPHAKWEQETIPDPFKKPKEEEIEEEEESTTDIHINAQLDVTTDADIKVIMDPISGDYATARGNGNFQMNFFNKGGFKMYGTYTLDHGLYKLSLQEVIRKDFILQPGGSITFSGLPEDGDIDLQAIYTVNSASLNDLAPNNAFSQNSVKVNCLLNLTGKLATPNIHFDLDLPNVNDEERELVRSYISTDEQMEMQIIYLLGIGRFYTYDYNNTNVDENSNGQSSAMNSLLSSTLSGQLNNMLSHVINSNKWNFGTNLSTGNKGWTDMEVEGMLSGRLMNNRLLINGNFGYRDNQLANTNFVGDFDVQWLLTPSGDISLKGYNQTNDRYFAKTSLTTQGIGILFKRDFGTWKELFFRNYRKQTDTLEVKKKKTKKEKRKKKEKKGGKRKWKWDF